MLIGAGIGIPFQQNVLARLLGSAEFFAPLTHSAIPTRAASGTTGTFTRATTSTWPNNDGYLVTGVAGEIGFVGARRVRNLAVASEDLSNAAWSNVGSASHTAGTVTFTASASDSVTQVVAVPGGASGKTVVISMTVSVASGTGQFRLQADQGGVANGRSADKTATTTPTRFSFVRTNAVVAGTGNQEVGIINGTGAAAATFIVTDVQLEDVTAQTTQTAGEYVSVGVESAPYYHGSFVDGVKCFATDLSGNPIPAATMLGYLAEGARTNLCLQSNAFTTTWTQNGTPNPTQNVVGPDGATSAWTLTDDSAVIIEGVYQSIALTAAVYTMSVLVKKTTGAQSSYPVIYSNAGSTIALATIDTSNGVATCWTAFTGMTILAAATARCSSYDSNFWRVELSYTASATAYIHFILPSATANATQSTGSLELTVQGSAVFYGAQVELGSFASSYIATTTAAVTRNADVLTYSSAGNILGTAGWAYAELSTYWTTVQVGGSQALGTGTVSVGPFLNSGTGLSTGVRIFDGTNVADATLTLDMYRTPRKRAARWGSDIAVCADGGAVVTGTFDGSMGSVLYIGCAGDTTQQWQGTIRNVRIGQRALSSSELQAITS